MISSMFMISSLFMLFMLFMISSSETPLYGYGVVGSAGGKGSTTVNYFLSVGEVGASNLNSDSDMDDPIVDTYLIFVAKKLLQIQKIGYFWLLSNRRCNVPFVVTIS